MKINYRLAIALVTGIVIGASVIQGLHAQAKPPAYVIVDINVTDPDNFANNYAPVVGKIITDGGGKYLARGGKIATIEGAPAKRLTVIAFPSLDQAVATFTSAAYKDARKTGDKYANQFHILAVEGLPQ
jgi:uncharacterized protein (DUF1330 family)